MEPFNFNGFLFGSSISHFFYLTLLHFITITNYNNNNNNNNYPHMEELKKEGGKILKTKDKIVRKFSILNLLLLLG